jgi:hypothetical protein
MFETSSEVQKSSASSFEQSIAIGKLKGTIVLKLFIKKRKRKTKSEGKQKGQ